jgi:hypothetical protein
MSSDFTIDWDKPPVVADNAGPGDAIELVSWGVFPDEDDSVEAESGGVGDGSEKVNIDDKTDVSVVDADIEVAVGPILGGVDWDSGGVEVGATVAGGVGLGIGAVI